MQCLRYFGGKNVIYKTDRQLTSRWQQFLQMETEVLVT